MPPKKDLEDWQNIPIGVSVNEFQDSPRFGSRSVANRLDSLKYSFRRSRFVLDSHSSQNSIVSFVETKKTEWDISISPSEKHFFWPSGALSTLSLRAQELSHFYVREHRNGFEAKYRAYQLASDYEVIDSELCDSNHAFLLQKQIFSKLPTYRLTLLTMLSSQELRRERVWSFELAINQDILKIYPENCRVVGFEAWPQSLKVTLE